MLSSSCHCTFCILFQINKTALYYSKMLHALILFTVFIIVQGNRCVQRSFGPDAIVCVCNSTYCDGIYRSELQTGQFQLYTSTKNGERLQFTVENFSTEPGINGTLLIVNSNQQYQEIHGFGGCLTDATALNIKSLSNETQRKLLESYFGSGDTGIRYTYVRLPIASTDFSTRSYTYDDTPGDVTLSNFSLVEEDNYRIEYLHQIEGIMSDADNLRIISSSWSAPPWMKTSNSITWGLLKPEYYQTYADYIKKFLDAYKERGINIWGFITGHEPMIGSTPVFYNAMEWSPNASVFWTVNYVVPTLSKAGYVPVYIAYDDERDNLQWYIDNMFSNEKANKLYASISVHWYEDKDVSPMVLTETHNKYPNKFIMMTEASPGEKATDQDVGVDYGSWKRGENFILDIIENLSHWAIGWVHFNMALNENGGPNCFDNWADSPIIVIPENDEFYKQPMYYAMAHISTFVPRFSRRILFTGFEDNRNISTIAFLTPEKKIVVIIVNIGDGPVNVTIKDNNANKINLRLSANSFNTLLYLAYQ